MPSRERLGHGVRHLGLGLDHLGAHFLHGGDHFLLVRDGHGAAFLRLGLGDAAVGLGLVHLQLRAHVAAHVHVGDVDGQDLKRGARVQPLAQHGAG